VKIARVESDGAPALRVGDELEVRVHVVLGSLTTDDVVVELYHGQVDARGQISRTESLPMDPVSEGDDGAHLYATRLPCRISGRRGYTVRVLPFHRDLVSPVESRLVVWA
jgi:starch phosphorylase